MMNIYDMINMSLCDNRFEVIKNCRNDIVYQYPSQEVRYPIDDFDLSTSCFNSAEYSYSAELVNGNNFPPYIQFDDVTNEFVIDITGYS